MVDFAALKAPFPMDAISWRASHMNKEGTKALALAYVDARDVMNRLDEVCGEAGWQCRYSHANGKTVCDIAIKCGDEWIWKADGAGDSDIEAEKGALSDAFKRAAVRWGIGRYLYDLDSPWVPCESYENNGKKKFSKFTADPWASIKPKAVVQKPVVQTTAAPKPINYPKIEPVISNGNIDFDEFAADFEIKVLGAKSISEITTLKKTNAKTLNAMKPERPELFQHLAKLSGEIATSLT